jgi:hypothetical protein
MDQSCQKELFQKKKIDLKKRCPTNEIFWFHALPAISEKPKKNCWGISEHYLFAGMEDSV